jgi:hypothetical protein
MEVPCPLLTPTVEFAVSLIEKTRQRMLKMTEDLSTEQILHIPGGFHNNLLWNLGHVVATQQILCYEKSGLPLRLPVFFLSPFRKGTHPGEWKGAMNPGDIKAWLIETVKLLREDLHGNVFVSCQPHETSAGIRLTSVSDAICFIAWHESQHLRVMPALRKLVLM